MKRYNAVVGGVYDNSVMVEERGGDWVWYEDVEEMVEAAKDVVARWDGPAWKWDAHTAILIDRLRVAIAKAEGDLP